MASFSDLVVKLELQQAQFQKGMDQAARQLARVQQSAKGAQGAMTGLENGMKGVAQAAAAAGAAFAAFKAVEAITKASDQINNLKGSFTALLGDAGRAGDMMARVFGIVERTGAPLEAAGGAMQRLTIAMQSLGASNRQIETVAETFIQLGKVGGSSVAETAGALQQLGQALASGKLGGDELKSIRENAPLVAEAIAESIGATSGQLKQLGEDGKLTSDVVANALIKASAKASLAFAQMPVTFEQALNKMEAQATRFGAALDKSAGITTTLVTLTDNVANNLARWTTQLERSNTEMGGLKTLAELFNQASRLTAVGWVAVSAALEMIAIRFGFIVEQIDLITKGDWAGVTRSTNQMRLDIEAAANAAERTIRELLKLEPMAASLAQARAAARGDELRPPAGLLQPPAGGGGGGAKGKSDAEKEAEALKKRGEALAASVDAQEAYNQKLREYDELLGKNAITQEIFEKAVAKAKAELTAQGDALKASVDPFFAYKLEVDKINEAYRNGSIEIEHWLALMEQLDNKLAEAIKKPKTEMEELAESATSAVAGGLGEFFTTMINGSKSVDQAFAKMVKNIISNLAKLLAEFAAKKAAEFIISSLFPGSAKTPGGKAAPASLMLASRPTTWNAAATLAGPVTRAGEPAAVTGGAGAVGAGGGPWNVVINNNAPGVDVKTAQRADGGLDVTVDKVRSMLAQDVLRGGNAFSRSLESAYALGRGR